MFAKTLIALGSAAVVAAHGGVIGYDISSTYYPGQVSILPHGFGPYLLNSSIDSLHIIPQLVKPRFSVSGLLTSTLKYSMSQYLTHSSFPANHHSPITDVTDPDLACNNPGTTVDPQLTATVPAGSAITAYWNNPWPHAIGPMMTYMAVSRIFVSSSKIIC